MEDGDLGEKLNTLARMRLHEPPESGERWGFPVALKEAHAAALRDGADPVVSAGVGAYPGRPPGPAPPAATSSVTTQRVGRQGGWQRPATLKGSSKRRGVSQEAIDEPAGWPSSRGDGQQWVDLAASSGNPGLGRCEDHDRGDSPQALSRESLGGALVAARRASAGVRSPRAALARAVLSPPGSQAGGGTRHAPPNAREDDDIERYLDYFAERNVSCQVGPRGSHYVSSATDDGEPEELRSPTDADPLSARCLVPAGAHRRHR